MSASETGISPFRDNTLAPDGGAPRTQESDPSAAVTLGTRTARPCGWWWLVTTPLLEPTCPTSARRSSREGSRATSHRAVARSQTCEDHATTPRRRVRARARIVLSRRGQLVSFTILSKEGKIDYVRAEHAPSERWVAPQPVGNARLARRRLAGLARRAGRGRA